MDTDDRLLYLWPPWAALVPAGIHPFSLLPALTTNPHASLPHAPHPEFHFLWGGQRLYLQMQQLFPKGKPGSIFEVGFSAVNHPFLPLSCLLGIFELVYLA